MITIADRKYIENKYHDTNKPFNPFRRMQYHGYEYPNNGLSDSEIISGLKEYIKNFENLSRTIIKARAIEFVLKNTKIDVNEHDYFIGINSWDRLAEKVTYDRWIRELFATIPEMNTVMQDYVSSEVMHVVPDFDHVIPDWNALLELGFTGIIERVKKYKKLHEQNGTFSKESLALFDAMIIEYTAIIDFIKRLYNFAKEQKHQKAKAVADCLYRLSVGAPQNFYDALQMIYIYFMISESVDSYQVRSLGHGLDSTLYPFYKRDLENGTFTKDEMKNLLSYFLMQWTGIGNYFGQPMYLGGTDIDGKTKVNELSYLILDLYSELGIFNPKVQIKVNYNTPKDFLFKAFNMIRNGQPCFVFCCEKGFIKAMTEYGVPLEEAVNFDIAGCYESRVRANEASTGCSTFNMVKPVLYVMRRGVDEQLKRKVGVDTGDISELKTFEDFYQAYIKQCDYLMETSLNLIEKFEKCLSHVNPSSLYSATIENSLIKGVDAYQSGTKYNNSCFGISGFASAVDGLMAIKKFVYEDKIISLEELVLVLDNDWVGYEKLRLKIKNGKYKYGNGEPETDEFAKTLLDRVYTYINNRPNARGGVYKTEMHSALHFVRQGKLTGATPDGRSAGEELSKNASPSVGMDKEGVTALIKSALNLKPYKHHEGFCLDVMLHPSSINGDEGLEVMYSLLMTYLDGDGMSLQFNVFDENTLLDAQKNPDKYKNLQVRVCGWNVLWNNLSKEEQGAYIERSKNILR